MTLLTIIIPTYNRAEKLSLLINSLLSDLLQYQKNLQLIVGDNSSTDKTQKVLLDFHNQYPDVILLRHEENVGPEENFCLCLERVKSRYFWIVGDDDLPKAGVIAQVMEMLARSEVDLLYLNSEWLNHFEKSTDGERIGGMRFSRTSQKVFSEKVNVWVTFISGIIVNRERLMMLNPKLDARRFEGTSLVQLGWVLPMLVTGSNFYICSQRCILATGQNSGGYGLFKVFGSNLPAIVNEVCGTSSYMSQAVRRKLQWEFIPRLIMGTRFARVGNFAGENILASLGAFEGSLAYYLALRPLILLPKFMAYLVYAMVMLPLLFQRVLAKFKWPIFVWKR